MLTNLYLKGKKTIQNQIEEYKGYLNNEKGAQALEWVALGVVVIAIMMAVSTAVEGNGSQIGNAIVTKLTQMIQSIGG